MIKSITFMVITINEETIEAVQFKNENEKISFKIPLSNLTENSINHIKAVSGSYCEINENDKTILYSYDSSVGNILCEIENLSIFTKTICVNV